MKRKQRYCSDYEVQKSEVLIGSKKKIRKTLVYKGTYYSLDASSNQVKKLKIVYLAYAILMTIIFLILGMLNHEGSRQVYILLPYVFMFLPIYYTILGAIKFVGLKEFMTRVEYEQSMLRLKRSGIGLAILSITAALGQILYIVNCEIADVRDLDYVFLTGCLFIGIVTQFIIKLQKRVNLIEK